MVWHFECTGIVLFRVIDYVVAVKELLLCTCGNYLAPGLSACISAILYSLVKYGVLRRSNSARLGLITAPLFFFLVGAVLTLAIGK